MKKLPLFILLSVTSIGGTALAQAAASDVIESGDSAKIVQVERHAQLLAQNSATSSERAAIEPSSAAPKKAKHKRHKKFAEKSASNVNDPAIDSSAKSASGGLPLVKSGVAASGGKSGKSESVERAESSGAAGAPSSVGSSGMSQPSGPSSAGGASSSSGMGSASSGSSGSTAPSGTAPAGSAGVQISPVKPKAP